LGGRRRPNAARAAAYDLKVLLLGGGKGVARAGVAAALAAIAHAGGGLALAMLAGLWVAISPWFVMLQAGGGRNATASNLIVGLAVAALGLFAISGVRGFLGLEVGKVLLGIWMIISPFILAVTYPIQAPMYWSNIWSGAVIAVLALASLASMRRHAQGGLRR
jgi:SPW repeat